jgi:spore coat polysaccharide biosynthesis protein SpsF
MTAIAIIQARMSSSRLPGKVLKPLAGRPMIHHIVERARASQRVDQVVVATSREPSDDFLADYCAAEGIHCHRGSLQNVLSRYLEVLDQYPHTYCVRITGDCPLIDPVFIDQQIHALEQHDGDLTWLSRAAPVLAGAGTHSTRSLRYIAAHSQHPDDLEHVGSRYIAEHPEQFRIVGIHPPALFCDTRWRVTVDEMADYELMQQVYAALWQGDPIGIRAVLEWLERHPELAAHNQSVPDSAINQEIHARLRTWAGHVQHFCDWDDASRVAVPSRAVPGRT